MVADIRDDLFKNISNRKYTANLISESTGVLSGIDALLEYLLNMDVHVKSHLSEGDSLEKGTIICTFTTTPKKMAQVEEVAAGFVSKPSGAATAARLAKEKANNEIVIVSGSFKKISKEVKWSTRKAMETGGIQTRITSEPFLYIDKNYITMLGGIPKTLLAAKALSGLQIVIQIHNTLTDVRTEAIQAIEGGAHILMVDTGNVEDLLIVKSVIEEYKSNCELAFSGNVKTDDIIKYIEMGVHRLCIGKDIIDAPMLDMKLDVINEEI